MKRHEHRPAHINQVEGLAVVGETVVKFLAISARFFSAAVQAARAGLTTKVSMSLSSGPNNPSSITDAGGWTDPTNVYTDNGSNATHPVISSGTGITTTSGMLRVAGFDFDPPIPAEATIVGRLIEIKRSVSDIVGVPDLRDETIRLTWDGDNGVNLSAGSWPETPAYESYGGPTDLGGDALTPEIVNDPSFGVDIAVQITDGGGGQGATANIDDVRVTVYYNAAPSSGASRRQHPLRLGLGLGL